MIKKFSNKYGTELVTIFPGELYISKNNEIITTLLGSCVSVCICDKENKVYGMNHFMLPDEKKRDKISDILDKSHRRYGSVAMKTLVNKMIKKGALKSNMKAKIFGGGSIISQIENHASLGVKNIEYARKFLRENNIEIVNEDTYNTHGRKLMFFTGSCSVYVKELTDNHRVNKNLKNIVSLC